MVGIYPKRFPVPENAPLWRFKGPENIVSLLGVFRGLKLTVFGIFRLRKKPIFGVFRPLKTLETFSEFPDELN